MQCPSCHAELPEDARYCVECGTEVSQAATGRTVQLPPDPSALRLCAHCGASSPAYARFCLNCGRPLASDEAPLEAPVVPPPAVPGAPPAPTIPAGRRWDWLVGIVFFFGMAAVFITRQYWPGMLIVVILSGIAANMVTSNWRAVLSLAVWAFAVLLIWRIPGLWMPVFFVALGVSVLVNALARRFS